MKSVIKFFGLSFLAFLIFAVALAGCAKANEERINKAFYGRDSVCVSNADEGVDLVLSLDGKSINLAAGGSVYPVYGCGWMQLERCGIKHAQPGGGWYGVYKTIWGNDACFIISNERAVPISHCPKVR